MHNKCDMLESCRNHPPTPICGKMSSMEPIPGIKKVGEGSIPCYPKMVSSQTFTEHLLFIRSAKGGWYCKDCISTPNKAVVALFSSLNEFPGICYDVVDIKQR